MPKLTKRLVDAAEAGTTETFLWDSEVKGFGVRVKPAGSKSFVLKYRIGTQTKRHTIGKVGSPYTVEEARKIAADLLRDIRHGADPAVTKAQARSAPTVADVCAWYLEQAEKGAVLGRRGTKIKASTLYQDRSRIETHVLPLLGKKRVDTLTLADIENFQADIAEGKTAKARVGRGGTTTGGTGAAARCVGMLRTIFAHAKRKRVISSNPATGVKKYAEGKNRRFLSVEEIATLGTTMREAQAEGESAVGIAAIRLLLMTGLRRMEALALPWAWIDAKARCIRFEDTKSGAQLRPIGAAALKFLDTLPHEAGSRWVFPTDRDQSNGHYVGVPKVLERVCAKAGLEGVTLHVLRHTFAATAAEMGFSELTIAGLLGHTAPGITARYAHIPDSALVVAADRVSARIAAALDGQGDAEVVSIRSI